MLPQKLIALGLIFLCGCKIEQQFTLVSRDVCDADLLQNKIVIEGRTISGRNYGREFWYQTAFPFLPFLAFDGWRHDVLVEVDRVIQGNESRKQLEIINYRQLTIEEIESLPYPHDVMELIGPQLRIRLGYDVRSGNRFSNLHIVAIENTPELTEALLRATTRPASRRSR